MATYDQDVRTDHPADWWTVTPLTPSRPCRDHWLCARRATHGTCTESGGPDQDAIVQELRAFADTLGGYGLQGLADELLALVAEY